MRLPTENRWTQTNAGKLFGFLNSTRGVHFDEKGSVTLSKRPVAYFRSTEDADFSYVLAILYFDGVYNFLTDDEMFYGDINANSFTEATNANAFTTGSDAVVCFGRLYVSASTMVDYWNGSSWNGTIGVSLTASKHHPMCVFENYPDYKLAIANVNTVTLYKSDHAAATDVLTIPAEYEITTMRYRNGYLYIGTKNINGGNAKVFIWNGSGTGEQYSADARAHWVFSMTEYGSSVAIVTSAGEIRQVIGSETQQIAAFPIYFKQGKMWQGSNGLTLGGKVFNRGMVTDGEKIYISIDGTNEGEQVEGMYSGLWCFDPSVGLYHKAGVPAGRVDNTSPNALNGNTVTMSAAIDAETGDPIHIGNPGSITGIVDQETYYVIKLTPTTLQFAKTRSDAHRGVPIVLGGTVGSPATRTVILDSVAELYGCAQGAVATINPIEQPDDMWNGGVLYGGKTSGSIYGIHALTPAQSVGSFTTQKIYSPNIRDTWERVYNFLSGIHLDNEKVIVKVKTQDKLGLPISDRQSITWVDATSFTTTDLTVWGAASAGDEVTVVTGTGAGKTAHITSITAGASVYTIVIDESIGVAAETGSATVDNFKKMATITNDTPLKDLGEADLKSLKSPWIMIRVEMRGYETNIPLMELVRTAFKIK